MAYFFLAYPAEPLETRSIGKLMLAYITQTLSNDVFIFIGHAPSIYFPPW